MAEITPRDCRRSRAWNRAEWLRRVRAWSVCGQTPVEYCRQEGLQLNSFHRWRRVFRAAGEEISGSGDHEPEASRVPLFAEVRVAEARREEDSGAIDVLLAAELRLRVHAGFDEATLRRVLSVVKESLC